MTNIRTIIRKSCLSLAVALLALTSPIATLSSVSAEDVCTPPDQSSYGAGVHVPAGAEAEAFTYQCEGPYVGKWLSDKYIYFPQSNTKEARDAVIYYYNDNSGKYDYQYWSWAPTIKAYQSISASTATPPSDAQKVGAPAPAPSTSTAPSTAASSGSVGASATSSSVSGTGPGSETTTSGTTNNSGTLTNTTNVGVNNTITSSANSGTAMVIGNTKAGSATTGDVITQANVTNMLQSSSNALGDGNNVATFTYNIDGDIDGDLLFDPYMLSDVQGDATTNNTLNNDLDITNKSDASITNNLTLGATSGDATVSSNGTAGNATTGSARSIANIVNSIRSAVTAGKSFVGTINITGNLNGDILLPANFVDTLIASNVPTVSVTGPGSTVKQSSTDTNRTTVTNTNDQGIRNTVNSTALTGDASVSSNTNAGSATSGTAKTNVTAFNLTGNRVIAKNSILVYVNNLGTWTGLIVNAPAGATAAMIGGNVTQNSTTNTTTDINNTSKQRITNNVNINATSGDATVSNNTNGGNAHAGDAETAVNLTNIEDSTFSLSDWFGILYINVFGSWNGSFGVDTAAGDSVGGRGADENTNQPMLVGNVSKLVRYAPVARTTTTAATASTAEPVVSSATTNTDVDQGAVLAAETKSAPKAAVIVQDDKQSSSSNLWLPAFGLIAAIAILGSEKLFSRRRI